MKVFPSSAIQFAAYDACKDVMMHLAGPGARAPAAPAFGERLVLCVMCACWKHAVHVAASRLGEALASQHVRTLHRSAHEPLQHSLEP